MNHRHGAGQADAESMIQAMYRASLAAAEPEAAVCRHIQRDGDDVILDGRRWPARGRLVVIGAGKAAVAMSRSVEGVLGDLICGGLVITKDGHRTAPLPTKIDVLEAAHPIPDERGVEGTRRILDMLESLRDDDVVVAVISGGGSALLEAPREGISLADMARVTELLLRAGAPIHDLNAVRSPLSRVKGGGVLQAARPATVLSLILSDVLGNDPRVIASGPTVVPEAPRESALDILERYQLLNQVPGNVLEALKHNDRVAEAFAEVAAVDHVIVADNDLAIDAAAEEARRNGKRVSVLWRHKEGEASRLGTEWARACKAAGDDVDVLVGGGEATVTVRGSGVGGRNTEFALAAAIEISSDNAGASWVVASLATDGQDALTYAAGAIAGRATTRDSEKAGVDPLNALKENDSLRVFERAGGLFAPGPTGTNVNDLYIGVRVSS
jgi:glycerate 2-kinase